jgi:hypothetical protein
LLARKPEERRSPIRVEPDVTAEGIIGAYRRLS